MNIDFDWNIKCTESLKSQRKEIEEKYGIRIGKTEIYCSRCKRPWGYGKHTCSDIRLAELRQRNTEKHAKLPPVDAEDVPGQEFGILNRRLAMTY